MKREMKFETLTAKGLIPYKKLRANKNIFYAPIALKINQGGKIIFNGSKYPEPDTNWEGHLLYALPGGGRWNSVTNKKER